MVNTTTVSFKATKKQIKYVDHKVGEGHFTSRGEYLRSLLRGEMTGSKKKKKDEH